MLARPPQARLRPFVQMLWAGNSDRGATQRERVLPTGAFHIVLRLKGPPLRLYDASGGAATVGHSIVGGARQTAYVRDMAEPTASVGAQLQPAAAGLLLGVPAHVLADQHTCLEDVWGSPAVALLRERLLSASSHEHRLNVFEQSLLARLSSISAVHPAVAFAVGHLNRQRSVADIVNASGLSHRHFNTLFAAAVGLTPKRFARVARFQKLVQLLSGSARPALVEAALTAGYSDQPHLNHEFQTLAGLTPRMYLRHLGPTPNHICER